MFNCYAMALALAHQTSPNAAALAGPAEVGIGIAVAYLGFDRFRYQKRVQALAKKLADDLGKPVDVLRKSLADDDITSDEKQLLTVFWFTDGQAFRNELESDLEKLKKSTFWNGPCFWLLKSLIHWKVDRRVVQTTLVGLCAWQLYLAIAIYAGGPRVPFGDAPWFGVFYAVVVAIAYAVPALSFTLSEWMMRLIHGAASTWKESMVVQLSRSAAQASIRGNGGPKPQPGRRPKPAPKKAPAKKARPNARPPRA